MTIERVNNSTFEKVTVRSCAGKLVAEFCYYKDDTDCRYNYIGQSAGSIPTGLTLPQLVAWFEYNTAMLKQLQAEGLYTSINS